MDDLVTVAVVTYNSGKTLIGTLNSIYNQTYENLELIISDDASTDQTVQIEESWLDQHKDRFVECKMLVAEKNKGTSYNIQQAVYAATGSWVKVMAADDYLLPDGISLYMRNINKNDAISIYEANLIRIDDNGNFLDNAYLEQWRIRRFSQYSLAEKQYRQWIKRDVILSPSIFFRVDAYQKMGGSDHFEPLIDDWTLVMKFLKNGYKVGYVNEYTVVYRKGTSISHTKHEFFNKNHVLRARKVKEEKCYPQIPNWHMVYWIGEMAAQGSRNLIMNRLGNKRNLFNKMVYGFFSIFQYTSWQKLYARLISGAEIKRAKRIWKENKELFIGNAE